MDADITRWFEEAVKNYELSNYKIEISRPVNGITGGLIADVAFAEINGKSKDNKPIEIHFICKYGKQGAYRETFNLEIVYEREIFFYDRILPYFQQFHSGKGLSLDVLPRCVATILSDREEVVVMEDLKYQGYELYDKEKPMEYERMKLVIDAYAKFHATSFALIDQKKEEYEKLTANISNVFQIAYKKWAPFTSACANQMYNYLKEAKELELAAQFKAHLLDVGVEAIVERVFTVDPDDCTVIIHADTNNNNFLFKSEEGSTVPTNVKILDWQFAILHSPVFDILAYISYTAGKDQIVHFEDLLNFYYERLSTHISKLGSNIEHCYPLSMFFKHIERYSIYCLLIMSNLPMMVINRDEYKLDLKEDEKVSDLVPKFDFEMVANVVVNRVVPLLKNYFTFRI